MSSNSCNFTNVKDGIFNNLYLINEDGGLDNIKDVLATTSDDLSDIIVELNKKAPKQNPPIYRYSDNTRWCVIN